MELTQDEIRVIVRSVLEEDHEQRELRERALEERLFKNTLIMIGIDPNQPDDQIAKDLKDFRAAVAHSDKWRKSVNRVEKVGITTAVTVVVTGMLGALWLGIADKIKLLHLP